MMGRLTSGQGQLFYQFDLKEAVPDDHLVRKIDAALDLSWLRRELAVHYSSMGRPSHSTASDSVVRDNEPEIRQPQEARRSREKLIEGSRPTSTVGRWCCKKSQNAVR